MYEASIFVLRRRTCDSPAGRDLNDDKLSADADDALAATP